MQERKKVLRDHRMNSRGVFESDTVQTLKPRAYKLYHSLTLNVDDSGFIDNMELLRNAAKAKPDDVRELLKRGLILQTRQEGVYLLTHHWKHNNKNSSKYKPSIYENLKHDFELSEESLFFAVSHDSMPHISTVSTESTKDLNNNTCNSHSTLGSVDNVDKLDVQTEKHIINAWNQCSCTEKIQTLQHPESRIRQTGCLIKEYGQDKVIEIISTLDGQGYLQCETEAGRTVKFDWMIQPETFRKLSEGKYFERYD